jgi:hypothetical protein
MANKVSNLASSSEVKALTEQEVQQRLRDKSSEVICAIAADNFHRANNYQNDMTLLEKGIFYPCEYFEALQYHKQKPRIDFFKNKDCFFHGYTSPSYFWMADDPNSPSGKRVACYALNTWVKEKGKDTTTPALPSDALKAMREGLSILGCVEACQIAQYAALEDVLGTEKFNYLFRAKDSITGQSSKTFLMIAQGTSNNPLYRLRVDFTKANLPISKMKKGDMVYIHNADSYQGKHLTGGAAGYNAICIDDTEGSQKFTALAFPGEGHTLAETEELLLSEYNHPYVSFESFTEKVIAGLTRKCGKEMVANSQANRQITTEEFKKQNGGKVTIICELDAAKITALANSTLAEAKRLLDGYTVQYGDRK